MARCRHVKSVMRWPSLLRNYITLAEMPTLHIGLFSHCDPCFGLASDSQRRMDMGRAAPALEVSAEERGELERLIRRHATAQQIAPRAHDPSFGRGPEGWRDRRAPRCLAQNGERAGAPARTPRPRRGSARAMPRAPGHRQGSSRSRLAPSSPWPVRRLKAAACLSPIGASGRSPTKRRDGASSIGSHSARSGVF